MKSWNDVETIQSSDANVKKYVFRNETAVAESVLYKYPTYAERTVICCSTQSGCPVGCRFCGAGDYFVRSLTAEEIVEQPVRLLADTQTDPATKENMESIARLAHQFFLSHISCRIEENDQKDEFGLDIVSDKHGIELGSYGVRKSLVGGYEMAWVYATGLAEPRLAVAMEREKE